MAVSPSNMVTVILSLDSEAGQTADYQAWHQTLVEIARSFEGLQEVKLVEPVAGVEDRWILVISFDTTEHLKAYLQSDAYRTAYETAAKTFGAPFSQQIVAAPKPAAAPVTVVVSQIVKPECTEAYQQWQTRVDNIAARYPGFVGTEMIKPVPGLQEEWVVVFRFDSAEHLDGWFNSEEHKRLVAEAEPYFDRVQFRRVGRGFDDWFANAAGEQHGGPPQWKVAMVVLLTLYPTVMLLTLFLSPFLSGLSLPYSIFISNVASVVILTWVVMPLATRALRFWLDEDTGSNPAILVLGVCLIVGLYGAMVAGFVFEM